MARADFAQLNYLGTALPELFAGVVCIGTLRNGDSYHLEVAPPEGGTHAVHHFDHDSHQLESTFSTDLESLAYLAALANAADEDLISKECAERGYRQLHGMINPTWHFGMEERAADFEPFVQPKGGTMVRFMFWRASWIVRLLRHDMHRSAGLPLCRSQTECGASPRRLRPRRRTGPRVGGARWLFTTSTPHVV